MDHITIEKLKVITTIGVYDFERSIKQAIYLDIKLGVDSIKAAGSDSLVDAVDYDKLTALLRAFSSTQQCQLIETFAEKTTSLLFAHFPITQVTLTVNKPLALHHAKNVSLTITRNRV